MLPIIWFQHAYGAFYKIILYLCRLLEGISQATVLFCKETKYNYDCQRVQKVFLFKSLFFVSMFTQ